jgi:hypothetical protein
MRASLWASEVCFGQVGDKLLVQKQESALR